MKAQDPVGDTRRDVLRKMAYVTPVVLSLAAAPAFARNGSGGGEPNDRGRGEGQGRKKRRPHGQR